MNTLFALETFQHFALFTVYEKKKENTKYGRGKSTYIHTYAVDISNRETICQIQSTLNTEFIHML